MYTYDDYLKKRDDYGFTADQISDADDRLAQMNPDAGMALLGYKNDWLTATNDSAKAMAHAGAEDIRSRYGNYTGGGNGGSFVPTGTAQYEDPWETAVNAQIRNLENRKFEWSPQTDPTLKYYEDAYRREGDRAMKDTLGAVAATTGGIPSSYATAAAAQQRNYYAQQLTDMYPQLYQQAFDRFMQEYDRDYQMLDAYAKMSDTEYGRWFDQQERDRQARQDQAAAEQQAFENQYMLDELELKNRAQDHTEAIDWERIGVQKDEIAQSFELEYAKLDQNDRQFMDKLIYDYKVFDASNEQFWAELAQDKEISDANIKLAYDQLSEEAQQFLKTHALAVQKHEDEVRLTEAEIQLQYDKLDVEQQESIRDRAYDYAVLAEEARQWDDQTRIRMAEIGIERDKLNLNASIQELETAFAAAEFGDFSYLRKLGIDTSTYEAIWNLQANETLNPTTESDGTQDDVIDSIAEPMGGENIMKKPTTPNGYDLNAEVIDAIAAQAPAAKAKADAEKAEYEASPEGKYESHMARYNELENKKGITTNEIVEREDLRKAFLIYDDIDNIIDEHARLKAKHPKTVEETRQMGLLERDIRTYNEYFGS